MKTILTFLIITFSVIYSAHAQVTGKVDYKYLGISFVVPDGWIGQESEGAFMMGSNTQLGLLLITTHEHSTLSAIEQEAKAGIFDQNGTLLNLEGNLEKINDNALGGLYSGTLEGQPIKSYMIGMINPYGTGITVAVLTSPEAFTDNHMVLAKQLANSISFRKPEKSPIVDQWKQKFTNARLTYMDSYYSSGTSVDGYSTGGGYSQKEEIDLCGQGYFRFNSSSSMSIDTGGAFGNSNSSGNGHGSWKISQDPEGNAVLVLTFYNGNTKEYKLTYDQDGKTFLNGYRYFVTYGQTTDDGPDCY